MDLNRVQTAALNASVEVGVLKDSVSLATLVVKFFKDGHLDILGLHLSLDEIAATSDVRTEIIWGQISEVWERCRATDSVIHEIYLMDLIRTHAPVSQGLPYR